MLEHVLKREKFEVLRLDGAESDTLEEQYRALDLYARRLRAFNATIDDTLLSRPKNVNQVRKLYVI